MSYAKYKDLGVMDTPKANSPSDPNTVYLIKSLKEKENLIRDHKVCVIDIYGDWCGPCKRIAPDFAKLASTYNSPNRCILVKEDVDMGFSKEVSGVPLFQFYLNGKLDGSITGGNIPAIEKKIKELLES